MIRQWVLSTRLGKWARKSPRNRAALFFIGLALIVVSLLLPGCERAELREQHCAQICIAKHGKRAWASWMEHEHCWCRLADMTKADEGPLPKGWRPE